MKTRKEPETRVYLDSIMAYPPPPYDPNGKKYPPQGYYAPPPQPGLYAHSQVVYLTVVERKFSFCLFRLGPISFSLRMLNFS